MPFYEYQCTECGHRLEALQKMADAPLVYCPECSEAALKKRISAAAFRLKGTGWYETDFKHGDRTKAANNADPAQSASGDANRAAEKAADEKTPASKPAASGDGAGSGAANSGAAKSDRHSTGA